MIGFEIFFALGAINLLFLFVFLPTVAVFFGIYSIYCYLFVSDNAGGVREERRRRPDQIRESITRSITRYNKYKWIGSGVQLVGGSLIVASDEYSKIGGSIALGGFALEKFSEWKKEKLQEQYQAVIEHRHTD